ncbi:MAG: hypothetical protein HN707_14145 [Verrucomicrobia bacterium]|nr:hypothetical protein [Verrucomicrobiota bacterium]MBT7736041.1 hypothetical protein [Verrucomicrobiota bacterium]MBT7911966.1 hypothetical protein [Verrucomicrobiota bacterium]
MNSNATVFGRLAKAIYGERQKPAHLLTQGIARSASGRRSRLQDIDEVGAKRLVVLCVLAR